MRDEDSNQDSLSLLDLVKPDCPVRLKIALFENVGYTDDNDDEDDLQSDRTVEECDVDSNVRDTRVEVQNNDGDEDVDDDDDSNDNHDNHDNHNNSKDDDDNDNDNDNDDDDNDNDNDHDDDDKIVEHVSVGHQQTDVAGAAECRDDQSAVSDILTSVEVNSSWLYSERSSLVAPPPVINSSSYCSSAPSSSSSSKAASKRKWNRLTDVLRPVRLNKIRFLK